MQKPLAVVVHSTGEIPDWYNDPGNSTLPVSLEEGPCILRRSPRGVTAYWGPLLTDAQLDVADYLIAVFDGAEDPLSRMR